MTRLSKYIINEGRSRGEDMEEAIISIWNGDLFPEGLRVEQEAAQKVVEYLKGFGLKGKGEVIGAAEIDVSDKWKEYFGGKVPKMTKTPKTDFVIGSDKISLKSGDSAQLMSGGKNESTATFYTALEKSKHVQNEVIKKLEESFENMAPASIAAGKIAGEIKKAEDKALIKADLAHKDIQKLLIDFFSKDKTFQREFAYEAMTGETKFGGNVGTCTHFLVVSWDGENNHYKDCNDTGYVDKIANRMKVSVRFKSTSRKSKGKKTGEYNYWSVVGLIVDKLNEEVSKYDRNSLNEGIFKDIWDKIKNWFKKVFKKIVNYIKENSKNLMNFLGLDPQVEMKNDINFV